MSSVPYSVAFGLLITASVLKNLRAVPVPTTTLPPLPARRYLEPFDKDPFKDYQDYQDVSKRTLAQQAIENAKKFPRPWGMPPPELFDNSFFNPNPFKEQDSRSILETNSIQPNYFEGYFPEDEFSSEDEENNFLEPPFPGDSNYLIEPPQLTYIEQPLMSSYQPNIGYSGAYVGNDINNKDEIEVDSDSEKENFSEEDDNDYDNNGNLIPSIIPQPNQQAFLPNGKFPQKPPQYLLKPTMNSDYDSVEVDNKPRQREFRSIKPPTPTKGKYTPPPPSESKIKPPKETKSSAPEDMQTVERGPTEKELFSRTTTITKTTTWYLNENNEITIKESTDERPSPLKGKYIKTSKTTTSGPVPWYLQGFEDVIFEEENEKSKTILDKINNLKGMTPTSITSFTTAPNPWSTEVHEEVVLEEVISKKENPNEVKPATYSSPLEHIVDYLPRTKSVSDEINLEKLIVEELVEFLLEEEEGVIEISILPDLPSFFPPSMPAGKQYPQFPFPMHPLSPPQVQIAENNSYEEEFYGQDLQNGMNQNQITTQKPLTTPSPMDNTYTPHTQIGPLQGPEQQMYSQPNFNYPQPTTQHPQLYANNQQQQSREHPNVGPGNLGNRREKMEQERRDKMNQGKRPMYPNAQQQKGMNRQGRSPRDL